jgi:glycosyltransferase involved in cell wall biosynthesis
LSGERKGTQVESVATLGRRGSALSNEILENDRIQDCAVNPGSREKSSGYSPVLADDSKVPEKAVVRSRILEKIRDHSISAAKRFLRSNPYGPIQRFLAPRLGLLDQYSPRPLKIPADYYRPELPESPPTISIVTPSFNHAHFLERTMKSVLDQHYAALEYAVIDGGSEDGTVEILERYGSQLTSWESASDNGQAHAINKGFKRSTGEIMAYLNSDDLLLPGTLNYVGSFFLRHPEIDVVYGHRILINQCDQEIGRWVMPPHVDEVLKWVDYLPQETMFWRRDLWEKVGGSLDERFQFAMDWDLILRFISVRARFVRLPRFLGAFRVHQQQKTLSTIDTVGKREIEAIRRAIHGRPVTDEEAYWRVKHYMLRHIFWHHSYSVGLFRY